MIQLPILHTSSGDVRIEPVSASLDLELEPLSSAELELKPGEIIPERSWVSVFTEHGLAGIFRSKPQNDRYGERSSHVSLVHGAVEMNDWLTGKSNQTQTSAASAIATIFQSYGGTKWSLGTVSPGNTVVYELNNSGVLDAITEIMEQIPGYMITFDQSSTPWVMNVVARPSEVSAEGRLSRNVSSVEISRDDSSLCTRVYYGDSGAYVQDSTAVSKYGIIEHHISDSGFTAQQLAAIAQTYLDNHSEPKLSVSISAIDLYAATGETLDRITLGSKYRLAIPEADSEENRIIEQVVCSIRYDDLFSNNPQIILSSDPETIISFLKKQRKTGGRAVQQLKEDVNQQYRHWTVENNQYKQEMYTITGVEYDDDGNVVYQVDPDTGEYILDNAGNKIPVYNAQSNGSISGQVINSAQKIGMVIEETNGVNKIRGGKIILAINQTKNAQSNVEAQIEADLVTIDGGTTTINDVLKIVDNKFQIDGVSTQFVGENSKTVAIQNGAVSADVFTVQPGGHITFAKSPGDDVDKTLTYTDVFHLLSIAGDSRVIGASVGNNILTLTLKDSTGISSTVNFSKATTLHTSGTYPVDGQNTAAGWSSGDKTFTIIGTQTNKNTTTGQDETTGVATEVLVLGVSDVVIGAPFTADSNGYTGQYTLNRSSGGLVSINSSVLAGLQAGLSNNGVTEIPLSLGTPLCSLHLTGANNPDWSSTYHTYTFDVSSSLYQGNTQRLSRTSASKTLDPVDAINYGKTLVYVSSATLTNPNYNATARTATATLNITLSNGVTGSVSGVNVSKIYQAGLDGDPVINSATFTVTMTDGGTWTNTDTVTITGSSVSDIYQQGADDATPPAETLYAYHPQGSYVNVRNAASSSSSAVVGAITTNTPVRFIDYDSSFQYSYVYISYSNNNHQAGNYWINGDYLAYTGGNYSQFDYLGWYNDGGGGGDDITSVYVESIVHDQGIFSGSVNLNMTGRYTTTFNTRTSAANPVYSNYGSTLETGSAGTYFSPKNGTYYATHNAEVYSTGLENKAIIVVSYSGSTPDKRILITFRSDAVDF